MSRTADIAAQRRRWQNLRQQFHIGFREGKAGQHYRPRPTHYFNRGYFHGWIEGRARFLKTTPPTGYITFPEPSLTDPPDEAPAQQTSPPSPQGKRK